MTLSEELRDLLREKGAVLVGFGDMRQVVECEYPTGVAVAVPVPVHIVHTLKTAPTKEYYEMYDVLNHKLNGIVKAGEAFLVGKGYQALAQTTDYVVIDENRRTTIPHKTVATRAGLGWIGKNCLLVTPQFGPAIRISSLLTDAPLEVEEPIDASRCGSCRLCVEACPANALRGTLWINGMCREKVVDIQACYEKQIEIMTEHTGIATDLCGKCFAVCAYTKEYLDTCKASR